MPTQTAANLVFTPTSNIAAQSQLLFGKVVLGQEIVELVHGQVDYVGHRDWQVEGQCLSLITSHALEVKRDVEVKVKVKVFAS